MSNAAGSTVTEETMSKGITAELFGEEQAVPAAEEPAEAAPNQEAEAAADTEIKEEAPSEQSLDDVLVTDAFKDKKVVVKIDGKEETVTVADLLKGYQTDQFLTRKGQKVAAEKQELEEMKRIIEHLASIQSIQQPQAAVAQADEDDFTKEYISPHLKPLTDEVSTLKNTINELRSIAAPMVYQNNLKSVGEYIKENYGFDDFIDCVPDIEKAFLTQGKSPQEMTGMDFTNTYLALKAKVATQQSVIPKALPTETRPKPRVVAVEGGSGSSSGITETNTEYIEAMARARQSGDMQDWARVIGLIGKT